MSRPRSNLATSPRKGISGVTEPKNFNPPSMDLQRIRCLRTCEGVLLYNAAADLTYEGNRLTGEVLQLLDGRHDIHAIAQCIADRYQIALETALQDVLNLLERLSQYHLLEV